MILSGFSTRDSKIVWGIDQTSHTAVVEVGGEFPIGRLKRVLQDPKLNKYKKVLQDVVDNHPDGKLPVGLVVPNHCIASCISLGIRTSNGNVDLINAKNEMAGLYLGSQAKVFKGKTIPVAVTAPQLPPKPKAKPKPKSLLDALESLEKTRQNTTNTKQTTTRQTRVGQRPWAGAVKAISPQCLITGITKDNMLEAAHIKPHARFSEVGIALDPNNGFMISRSLHPPFDAGEWSLDKDGKVILSPLLSNEEVTDLAKLGLVEGLAVEQPVFTARSEYFDWHRNNVFKK